LIFCRLCASEDSKEGKMKSKRWGGGQLAKAT
jgi:hypothetical protein